MRFGLGPAGRTEVSHSDLPRNGNLILAMIVKETRGMEEELNGVVKDQEDHSETLQPERVCVFVCERENDYAINAAIHNH